MDWMSPSTLLQIRTSQITNRESLGYMWVYLLRGAHPWQTLDAVAKKAKYEKIKELLKEIFNIRQLIVKQIKVEFASYCLTSMADLPGCNLLYVEFYAHVNFS
jgi:hypothetical protein